MVEWFGLVVTEELSTKNMSRAPAPKPNEDSMFAPNGVVAKEGLNRGILDAAPAGRLGAFRYKAQEAGSKFMETPTRKVKPAQRFNCCGAVAEHELKERYYRCACGDVQGCDRNAARTILRYAYEGAWWVTGKGP